jgi:UDP-N-acetylmuramate: L-alanyl-gamma-D-glutamyl-meso-diaminopimelate ligase
MHAKKDNPELLKAQELGLKIYSYPEFLFEQSKEKTRVVIAGSHGKTTITSMILHVLNNYHQETDFMVGAQLQGFDCMVKISNENDFMILEGDEYLSSPIDASPKFLHYHPNIALISGISWDHINVFKTFKDYIDAFRNFIKKITPGGILVYNEEDENIVKLVEEAENYFRKIPYKTPNYDVKNGKTSVETEMGNLPLKIFGKHNLQNLEGARLVCNQLGILDEDFYEAMMSFSGASKRLEKIKRTDGVIIYRDFAHAPSKVKATTEAFAEQFPTTQKIGFLELHTYSSLSPEFLSQYKNTLEKLDEAVVFYDLEALKIKNMAPISPELIKENFGKENLTVFTNVEDLKRFWQSLNQSNVAFLMMSSGNFGGISFTD